MSVLKSENLISQKTAQYNFMYACIKVSVGEGIVGMFIPVIYIAV